MTPTEEVAHLTADVVGLLIIIGGAIMLLLRKLNVVEFGDFWVIAAVVVLFMCIVTQDNAIENDDGADCLPP
ncbi:hypothetical protein HON36_05245 [Candidatus Parcubacteria bacterium]|nr:hypothetical protein [Candidatus Parcubacteria bacterium]MBT7228166.1 hypothetical protein [Candidatus Parcubacteria bacterium]